MNKRVFIIGSFVVAALLGLGWYLSSTPADSVTSLFATVTRGPFIVTVTTTGELQAKNSIEVKGPESARAANIWQMKISNLVPEGTTVKAGQFVAELDRSEITQKLKESELSVQKFQSQYDQAVLDSALALSQARDDLVNLRFSVEEKKIAKDQSVYEAPAMQRQAEIDLERAQRTFDQSRKNYSTKRRQSIAKIKAVEVDLLKEQQRLDILKKTVGEFTIKAPAEGMVIYAREWNGRKKVVGSTINPWDATVATLPDLSVMESITYVNEVDIQKIAVGQSVGVKLDADPNKSLTGKITQVANIGEQRPNADSKVFEVRILINEADTTLRPAMTTSNTIVVTTLDNVLAVPLESIHAEGGRSYVYTLRGGQVVKQEVRVGAMNDNEAVIEDGLAENENVYLSAPAESPGMEVDTLTVSMTSK